VALRVELVSQCSKTWRARELRPDGMEPYRPHLC
jgi:hypothetical protein